MAYHLESLVQVIDLILSDDRQKFLQKKAVNQVKSLLDKACFLRYSFENHPILSQQDSFEDQIRDAAQNAEDVLETHVAFNSHKRRAPPPYMHKLLEDFDSAKEEMMKILDVNRTSEADEKAITPAVASSRINPKNIVVGFTNDLLQLKDRVLGDSSKLEIIPIVGMGGIGKTTLARSIHDDSSVVPHFDARGWTTVSDDYSICNILLDLLSSITGRSRDEIGRVGDNTLGVTLYQTLKGCRYLIVLDDIWRSKAWDDVKMLLPNDNNGSRIILTTRESHVATYVDSKTLHHQVHPLREVDSWELLRKKIFDEETCPPELEEIGIEIANSCGGLPLAIQVIGGLLSQTERSKNSWEPVANDVISSIANKEEMFSRILSLSYDHLPYYLKPCFLYMSAFPEDYKISVQKLIRLWAAEGFIKPIQGKSLEDVATEHLNSLIVRNLLFVSERSTTGKVKTCIMHDLLRDLCVMKSREKKFFHPMNGETHNIPEDVLRLRRVSVLTSSCIGDIYGSTTQESFARSLILATEEDQTIWSPVSSTLRWLRVLDVYKIEFEWFPTDILQLTNLRYLAFYCLNDIHPGIASFRNLQTLILCHWASVELPEKLFELQYLREIKVVTDGSVICDLKKSENLVPQLNMHSLSLLDMSFDFEAVIAKFPNLKKLKITLSDAADLKFVDLACLQKLERLELQGDPSSNNKDFFLSFTFPVSLKKLTLEYVELPQEFMTTIGTMPNLEVLKLAYASFGSDTIWKPTEGEFCKLQYLVLVDMKLVNWEADETHFPRLQHLTILRCGSLEEIPSSIGEISTLRTIVVSDLSDSAMDSARKIQEEQLDLGNDLLQVRLVKDPWSA